MKKTLLALTLVSGLLLTGCTTGPDMTTATNTPMTSTEPTTSPEMMPNATESLPGTIIDGAESVVDGAMEGLDSAIPNATAVPESMGVTSMDKAKRVIEQIEDELERLSEVDDAQVVIAGNKAAVALEFDDQYKAGIDDRLRGIVKERIGSVISGISTVAITSDETIMDALETLGDRLDTTSDMNALQADLDAIIKKIEAAKA